MCDNNRPQRSNDAVDKIIGNMTAEMQNNDGQYVPLGYSQAPSSSTAAESISNWSPAAESYLHTYNMHNYGEPHLEQQFGPPPPLNFIPQQSQPPQPHLFDHQILYQQQQNTVDYNNMYNQLPNKLESLYNVPSYNGIQPQPTLLVQPQPSQLIENLVGNWVVPNNTGTYSPFGTPTNIDLSSANNNSIKNDQLFMGSNTHNKPRIVAEVKPMRPSYSDVLLTKPNNIINNNNTKKSEQTNNNKEITNSTTATTKESNSSNKLKKDKTKNITTKQQNSKPSVHRTNTSNDIIDKSKIKMNKSNTTTSTNSPNTTNIRLNRKWASLDNINHASEQLGNIRILEDTQATAAAYKRATNHRKVEPDNPKIVGVKSKSTNSRGINRSLNVFDFELNNTTSSSADEKVVGGLNKSGGAARIEKKNYSNSNSANVKGNVSGSSTGGGNGRVQKHVDGSFEGKSSATGSGSCGKRGQRGRKRDGQVPFGICSNKIKDYTGRWCKIIVKFFVWLCHLISDVCSLSLHIARDVSVNSWHWSKTNIIQFTTSSVIVLKKIQFFTWIWKKFKGKTKKDQDDENSRHPFSFVGLQNNINMPTTGDEAMKRLLACKEKDPYSILGVTPTCSDDDIKKYYKRQAVLVHPDKNNQPGAEEAFKILVHAFDMIGTPARRQSYDRGIAESAQMAAWTQVAEMLHEFQQNFESVVTTIRCSACGSRHKRSKVERPSYAARNCNSCKIHHSAREGDIWAESRCFGVVWHYFACMEGAVYDITEWAACQKDSLKHLKPDSHHVQYRIALGKQNQPRKNSATGTSPRMDRPDLENLLNSLYGQNLNESYSRRRNKTKK